MKAIFNKNCILVGWYDQRNRNVFNKELMWIGFMDNNYFFAIDRRWLGGVVNGTYVDKSGKPVAFIEGYSPIGCNKLMQPGMPYVPLHPMIPLRPLKPITPFRPLTPLGGWSKIEWDEYINQ